MQSARYTENQTFCNLTLDGNRLSGLEWVECRFEHCVFENLQLTHIRLSDCIFTDCQICNPEFDDTVLCDCNFEHCQLAGINWSLLVGGGFLVPIESMTDCRMKYNNFLEMNLTKFDFSGCEIVSSLFGQCDLSSSQFRSCNLNQTEFFKCDLRKADFRGASGYQIDLESNQLKKARFSFPEVIGLLNGLGIVID